MTDPVTLPREDADLPSVMAALRPLGWKSEESLRQAAQAALRQSLESAPQEAEPVAWQRQHPTRGWIPVDLEDVPHYLLQGQKTRRLIIHRDDRGGEVKG